LAISNRAAIDGSETRGVRIKNYSLCTASADSNHYAIFSSQRLATRTLVLPLLYGNRLQVLPLLMHRCVNSEHTNMRWCYATVSSCDSHARELNCQARINGLLMRPKMDQRGFMVMRV
jgi:hypothetical protein